MHDVYYPVDPYSCYMCDNTCNQFSVALAWCSRNMPGFSVFLTRFFFFVENPSFSNMVFSGVGNSVIRDLALKIILSFEIRRAKLHRVVVDERFSRRYRNNTALLAVFCIFLKKSNFSRTGL